MEFYETFILITLLVTFVIHCKFWMILFIAGLYSLAHRNSRAIVPLMTSLSASSLLTCATRCAKTSFCFAFNFMKTSSGTPLRSVTCELLSNGTFADFQESITSLVQKANWTVYVLKYQ